MLETWPCEPRHYALVVVYAGEAGPLLQFLGEWVSCRGNVDVVAAHMPTPLPWANGHPTPVTFALSLSRVPAYRFIGYWIERPEQWKIFYRERPAPEDPADEEEPAAGSLLPAGTFVEWGYSSPPLATAGGARLLPAEGAAIELPSGDRFGNLLEQAPQWRAVLADGAPQVRLGKGTAITPAGGPAYTLPIRLIEEIADAEPNNPDAELRRLQAEITLRQERVDHLLWYKDLPEPMVLLYGYPETPHRDLGGTIWVLRDWFAAAPDAALEQFRHARVAIEGFGVMHLVIPADLGRNPTATLPPASYVFRLDRGWQRKGRKLFLPKGFELIPQPPPANGHVEGLLASCLWNAADQFRDILILLRDTGREPAFPKTVSFTVPDAHFRSLKDQVQALNIQIAIQRVERNPTTEANTGLEDLLNQVRADLANRLAAHAEEMRLGLETLWSGDRPNLDQHRQEVRRALDMIQQLREARDRISQLRQHEWPSWEAFFEYMQKLDAALLPSDQNGLRSQLETLDGLRGQLARLWMADKDEAREALAKQLDDLATRVRRGT